MLCGSDRAPGVRLTVCLLPVHGEATEGMSLQQQVWRHGWLREGPPLSPHPLPPPPIMEISNFSSSLTVLWLSEPWSFTSLRTGRSTNEIQEGKLALTTCKLKNILFFYNCWSVPVWNCRFLGRFFLKWGLHTDPVCSPSWLTDRMLESIKRPILFLLVYSDGCGSIEGPEYNGQLFFNCSPQRQ